MALGSRAVVYVPAAWSIRGFRLGVGRVRYAELVGTSNCGDAQCEEEEEEEGMPRPWAAGGAGAMPACAARRFISRCC
eukprot:2777296-Pleurochrysis_carterae.AAC.6